MPGLKINHNRCTGCGACIDACPATALSFINDKAHVDDELCVLCGICIGSCGFDAISIEKDSYGITDTGSYRGIWVFCEQHDGSVLDVAYQLIGKARELSAARGCEVAALLLGHGVSDMSDSLIAAGADTVYLCDASGLRHNLDLPFTEVITALIREHRPETLLFGATAFGRSLAPRVAARVETGLTADCTVLSTDENTGLLLQTRPAFGGNLMATIQTESFRPQMATVRPGVLPAPTPDPARPGSIIKVLPPKQPFTEIELLEELMSPPAASIADAEIIVAAGKGIDSLKNMALVEELAGLLGGAVGCSRAVVDIGWAEYRHQIGQTGLAVQPKLLIACGISGSIQFLAGIGGAKKIVAINTDTEAPIFGVAHYKIVGDCVEVLSALIARIKAERGL